MTDKPTASEDTSDFREHIEATPISGESITVLQEVSDTTSPAMAYFLGLTVTNLGKIKKADENGVSPRLSLMTRYLQRHPEHLPSLDAPTPRTLFDKIKKILPNFTQEHFCRLLGYQRGSPGHLFPPKLPGRGKKGPNLPATVRRYMLLIDQAIDEDPNSIHEFVQIAEAEATARGQDPHDMWTSGWATFPAEEEGDED